jgi:hypothetical protein
VARYIFWTAWSIATIVAAIVLYFFVIGLADGTVSSSNGGIWAGLLAVVGLSAGGSLALHAHGRRAVAIALALVLAIPGVFGGLFILIILITNPRWN